VILYKFLCNTCFVDISLIILIILLIFEYVAVENTKLLCAHLFKKFEKQMCFVWILKRQITQTRCHCKKNVFRICYHNLFYFCQINLDN